MTLKPFTAKRKNKGEKCVSRVLANRRCAEIIDESLPSVKQLVKCTNNTAELWTNFVEKTKQLVNQMRPPKNNHIEYVTEKTLEIMKERGKRKQEFIELKKQQETKNTQEQKLEAKIRLNKMDAKVQKAIAEDKDSWIQQNTDEIRMAAC